MFKDYQIVCEALKSKDVPFIIHAHQPRSGSLHYDLRFGNPHNEKELHSFAMPKNFLETKDSKTVLAKTKMHNDRWLKLQSYRMKTIDEGTVTLKIATSKYFELEFHGKVLNGSYKIFKIKSFRDDRWLLVKDRL